MGKVVIGECRSCGRELRVKEESAKSIMHLTCKCGWRGYVGGESCEKVKCKNCGLIITSEVYKAHRGLCSPCAKWPSAARRRRIPRWKCPHCNAIFLRDENFQKHQEAFQSVGGWLGSANTVCANCGQSLDGKALYSGDYDYRGM